MKLQSISASNYRRDTRKDSPAFGMNVAKNFDDIMHSLCDILPNIPPNQVSKEAVTKNLKKLRNQYFYLHIDGSYNELNHVLTLGFSNQNKRINKKIQLALTGKNALEVFTVIFEFLLDKNYKMSYFLSSHTSELKLSVEKFTEYMNEVICGSDVKLNFIKKNRRPKS